MTDLSPPAAVPAPALAAAAAEMAAAAAAPSALAPRATTAPVTAATAATGLASRGNPALVPNPTLELSQPRAQLVCFHGASSEGTIFTGRGSRARPLPNPLLDYCIENDIQLLAVNLAGRGGRRGERAEESALGAAERLFEALRWVIQAPATSAEASFAAGGRPTTPPEEVPLVLLGHSLGCLVAYEFACLMRSRGFGLPKYMILASMVAPDVPPASRPWPLTAGLDAEALRRECQLWGSNEELFRADVWAAYEPLLRADFAILDNYVFASAPEAAPGAANARGTGGSQRPRTASASSGAKPAARGGGARRRHSPGTASTSASAAAAGAGAGGGGGGGAGNALSLPDFSKPLSFHAPLGVSTVVFLAEDDARISPRDCEGWRKVVLGNNLFSSSPSGFGMLTNEDAEFELRAVARGGHNFLYDPQGRAEFMVAVTEFLDRVLIAVEHGLY